MLKKLTIRNFKSLDGVTLEFDMQGLKENGGAFDAVLRFREYLARFQSFLLWNPKDLRKPHQGLAMRLGPSGEQLPGFWAYLHRKEPNRIQVFMTSHSPYVLNEFAERPEAVHIFEKGRRDSVPRISPLTEHSRKVIPFIKTSQLKERYPRGFDAFADNTFRRVAR